ncbi:MAG: AIR synthase family protein [Acetatifactor sp.]|nr:AIR synthase family protein [Acetatifactor sp.]
MRLGKISDSVLKRSVLGQIKTRRQEVLSGAGIGEDCAIFAPSGPFASTVAEATVCGGRDLAHTLVRCANNLATAGADPMAALITLILPQETEEQQLRELMAAAEEAGNRLGIQIAGGHTTVSTHVDCPIACVTAYGIPMKDAPGVSLYTTRGARPGQDIVLTKWIALEGTAVLAGRKREELRQRYPAHLVEEAAGFERYLSVVPEAAVAVKSGVQVMHDASEGGILATLWELAECSGVGLTIDLRKIPIRQETVEVCEFCEVNPYMLASGGCLVLAADHGEKLVEQLAGKHIPAAVIGQITDSHDRLIYNMEEKRYLDKPAQDEIYKDIVWNYE